MLYTFKSLLNSFLPKTYIALTKLGALEDKYLNMLFIDLFMEILPTHLVQSLVDAYLLEGKRILFRYGLALIRAYKTYIKLGKLAPINKLFALHVVKFQLINVIAVRYSQLH